MLRLLIAILIAIVSGIEIPKKGWVDEGLGILMEPDSLIIHYDKVIYTTVGVRFALIPPEPEVSNPNGCALGVQRMGVLKSFNKSVDNFFKTIPNHFADFTNHYCKDKTIDCFIQTSDHSRRDLSNRSKRQLFGAILAVGGLAAVGSGLYHLLSEKDLSNHLRDLDNKIRMTSSWIQNHSDIENQYKKVSEDLYTKLYHGTLNNERLLANSICRVENDDIYDSIYLHYTLFFENYKNNFLKSMDGKVTEFLVSYDFLVDVLLNNPELEKSAYRVDPGLFYVASTGMLTRVDKTHRIAYFTITTPILQEADVSPLYRIHNMGWWEQDNLIRLNLPDFGYFLTDKEQVEIATPNLDRCQRSRGIYMCHLKDSQLSNAALCLTSLVLTGSTKTCTLRTKNSRKSCEYEITKGGVLILGCKEVFKISSFRGVLRKEEIMISSSKSLFIPYSEFDQISIEQNVVSSRGTHIQHVSGINLTRPRTNLSDIQHLLIPGIDQDLEELRSYRKKSTRTTEGFLKDVMAKYKSDISWFWYIIGFFGLINAIIVLKKAFTYFMCCKPDATSQGIASILEMRRLRSGR